MPVNDLPRSKFSLTNIAAVLGVLALHGLATWGLANVASPDFPVPKIDDIKPIEIQLVTPMEEKPPQVVEIEKVEPTPIKSMPEPKPVVAPKPEPKPKPVIEPKPAPKPKPKPVVEPKPKPKPVVEPKPKPKPKVVQDTSTVNDNSFALEQQRQAELEKQRQIELNKQRQAELDQQRKAELDQQRQADLEKQRQAELEKQRQAALEKQRQADLAKQRQAELDKQKEAASNTPVNFSANQASWRRAPNFRSLERLKHGGKPGDVLTVVVTLTVDKQGNVTNVAKNNSSGNAAIDGGVIRAVKASKLNPFTQNGSPVIGTITLPVEYIIPGR